VHVVTDGEEALAFLKRGKRQRYPP
jgi:hypothetical protein